MNSKNDDYVSLDSLIVYGNSLIENGDASYIDSQIDTKKHSAIIYTSGTTGIGKGVMLSQENLISNITAAASMVFCGKDDVVISILPIHHTYEFTCTILAVLLCEATICFNESLKHLSDNLKLFKPTLLFLVPLISETVYKKIIVEATKSGKIKKLETGIKISNTLRFFGIDIRNKLFADVQNVFGGRLKKVVVGGAPMNSKISKAYRDIGILMLQGYGITECSPLVAVNREKQYNDRSVGLIVPCNEVRIKDGEIQVKGSNVMLGYYKNEQATKETFDGEWFKTGDLGYIDKEGFLFITGRKKNLIILDNGKNIYPEEMEGYLLVIKEIKEVVVYSENNLITADIYPDVEIENVEKIIKRQIESINKTLPLYKQVQTIKFRQTEFEKTTTKKIKRHKVGGNNNV
jgi:long-chain acyl-CoA synthetase